MTGDDKGREGRMLIGRWVFRWKICTIHQKLQKNKKSIYGWSVESFVLCSNLPRYRLALFGFKIITAPSLSKLANNLAVIFSRNSTS